MADRPFEFDLFRLVIVEPDVFDFIGAAVNGDAGILQMIQEGCINARRIYLWSKESLEMESQGF